jgi:predicted nucleic acid-binding protein
VILVDTSVWIDHLRSVDRQLAGLLLEEQVLCHPFVVGELACGGLKRRAEILVLLRSLPHVPVVEDEEVLAFIEARALMGSGLGWVDVHLLASVCLAGERLLTSDRRLAQAARRLKVAAS